MELKIDRLTLRLEDIPGQEHRAGLIAERAAALFAERVGRLTDGETPRSANVESLQASSVNMNLQTTSTEHAAGAIADAWLQALMLELRR